MSSASRNLHSKIIFFIAIFSIYLYFCDGFYLEGCRNEQKPRNIVQKLPSIHSKIARSKMLVRATPEQLTAEEDAAIIESLEREVMEVSGVKLEQLLNPSKVVNLERELFKLRRELSTISDAKKTAEIQAQIQKTETKAAEEKRTYMRDWLKTLFVGQAVVSVFIAGALAYGFVPFVEEVDISVRVLGFWSIWLFTIPSLRARKPQEEEKVALNWAFGLTPLTNLLAPFLTKDPIAIYWANLVVTGLCYGYGYTIGKPSEEEEDSTPDWIKKALKALDYGAGKERGARK